MESARGNRITEVLRTLQQNTSGPQRISHRFGRRGEFGIRVASTIEDRLAAWRLAYRVYRREGYAPQHHSGLWYSIFDALPQTVTCTAEQDRRTIGAITLVPDSPLGLPAEETFPEEVAALRAAGARMAESVALVQDCQAERAGARVVNKLLELTCLVPARVLKCTHMICTVNPRHARYYTRLMRFRQRGGLRNCARVSAAPAVFLVLAMRDVRRHVLQARKPGTRRTLYRSFISEDQSEALASEIRRRHRPLAPAELRTYFAEQRRLLQELATPSLQHLARQYPGYDFETIIRSERENGTRELEAVS